VNRAVLRAIEYYLPSNCITNARLAETFGVRAMDLITRMTGVEERRIAREEECASDMAVEASRKLFDSGACTPGEIDFLLFCTESPDYFLPASACLIQHRLGLAKTTGAFDFNLGCSGFVYGLSLAKGLIETGQANRVLLLTGDTPSKFMDREDRSVRPLFGDSATATLIEGENRPDAAIGPFVFGTDGSGAAHLCLEEGGFRYLSGKDEAGQPRSICQTDLKGRLDGPHVFDFAVRTVPPAIEELLRKSGAVAEEIDLFVFHQASKLILERLRNILGIPEAKFCRDFSDCGNTIASSIPIALKRAWDQGRIGAGTTALLAGFGVGYSWSATLVRWS